MTDFPEQRASPLVRQVVLWVLFLALVGVGVATVIVPELGDEPPEDQRESSASARSGPEEPPEDQQESSASARSGPGATPEPD